METSFILLKGIHSLHPATFISITSIDTVPARPRLNGKSILGAWEPTPGQEVLHAALRRNKPVQGLALAKAHSVARHQLQGVPESILLSQLAFVLGTYFARSEICFLRLLQFLLKLSLFISLLYAPFPLVEHRLVSRFQFVLLIDQFILQLNHLSAFISVDCLLHTKRICFFHSSCQVPICQLFLFLVECLDLLQ